MFEVGPHRFITPFLETQLLLHRNTCVVELLFRRVACSSQIPARKREEGKEESDGRGHLL